jgi:hypothetical protein
MREHGPGPRATGAVWSPRAMAGSGQEIGGADVGLRCAGYAAPSSGRLLVHSDRAPELDPEARATRRSWSRRAVAGLGLMFAFEDQVAYVVRVAKPRPAGCLGGVSRPNSRDASSKATPAYHPRG